MTFKEHPLFKLPEERDTKIWRYISTTKFLSLLKSKSLYFSRADKLREIDPYEGSFPRTHADHLNRPYSAETAAYWACYGIPDKDSHKDYVHVTSRSNQLSLKYGSQHFFINCWHMSDDESDAMWKIYSGNNEGVCLKSSVKKLLTSFDNFEKDIHVGQVEYINYSTQFIGSANSFSPYLYKRISFNHEREIRAILWTIDETEYKYLKKDGSLASPEDFYEQVLATKYPDRFGINIPVDISNLVDAIHVSPTSPDWYLELIADVISKYGYKIPVVQSEMI